MAQILRNSSGRRAIDEPVLGAGPGALKGQVVTAGRRLYEALARGPLSQSIVWIEDIAQIPLC